MPDDPVSTFGGLLGACVNDDGRDRPMLSLFTATAISFAMGIIASGLTTYLLTFAHVLV